MNGFLIIPFAIFILICALFGYAMWENSLRIASLAVALMAAFVVAALWILQQLGGE